MTIHCHGPTRTEEWMKPGPRDLVDLLGGVAAHWWIVLVSDFAFKKHTDITCIYNIYHIYI